MNLYFTFKGNCEEAMQHYALALGGEIKTLQRFKDGDFPDLPKQAENLVMHCELVFPEGRFMASDSMPGADLTTGNRIAVNIEFEKGQAQRAEAVFNALAGGGEVLMGFQKTFWGAYFGQCLDRYGFRWMVNVPVE